MASNLEQDREELKALLEERDQLGEEREAAAEKDQRILELQTSTASQVADLLAGVVNNAESHFRTALDGVSYDELKKLDRHEPDDGWNIAMRDPAFQERLKGLSPEEIAELKEEINEYWEDKVHPSICTQSAESLMGRLEEELSKAVENMDYEELKKFDKHGPDDAWNILLAKSGIYGEKLKKFGEPVLSELKERAQEEWEDNVHPNVCTQSAEKAMERLEEELKKAVASMDYEELKKFDKHGPDDAWNILLAKSGIYGEKLKKFGEPVLNELKERAQEKWEDNVHPNVCTQSAEKATERLEEELKKAVENMDYEELKKFDKHGLDDAWNILLAKSGVFGEKLKKFGEPVLGEIKERAKEVWEDKVHPSVCTKSAESLTGRLEEELSKAVENMDYEELKKFDKHGPDDSWNILLAKSGIFGEKLKKLGEPVLNELKERAQEEWEDNVHPNVCTQSAEKAMERLEEELKKAVVNMDYQELKKFDKHGPDDSWNILLAKSGIYGEKLKKFGEPVLSELKERAQEEWEDNVHPNVCTQSAEKDRSRISSETEKIINSLSPQELRELTDQPDQAWQLLLQKGGSFAAKLRKYGSPATESLQETASEYWKDVGYKQLQEALTKPLLEAKVAVPKLLEELVFETDTLIRAGDFSAEAIMKKKAVREFLEKQQSLLSKDQYAELLSSIENQVKIDVEPRWTREQEKAYADVLKTLQGPLKAALDLSADDITNEDFHGVEGEAKFRAVFLLRSQGAFPPEYAKTETLLQRYEKAASEAISAHYREWSKLHEEHHEKENLKHFEDLKTGIQTASFDRSEIERKQDLFDSPEEFRSFFLENKLSEHKETLEELEKEAPSLYQKLMSLITEGPHDHWKKEYLRIEEERLEAFQTRAEAIWEQQKPDPQDPQFAGKPALMRQYMLALLPSDLDPTLLENEQEANFREFQDRYLDETYQTWSQDHQRYREELTREHHEDILRSVKALKAEYFKPEERQNETVFREAAEKQLTLKGSAPWPEFLTDELEVYRREQLSARFMEIKSDPELKVEEMASPAAFAPEVVQKNLGQQLFDLLHSRSLVYQQMHRIDSESFAPFFKAWGALLGKTAFEFFLDAVTGKELAPLDLLQAIFTDPLRARFAFDIRRNNPDVWQLFMTGLARLGYPSEKHLFSSDGVQVLQELGEEEIDEELEMIMGEEEAEIEEEFVEEVDEADEDSEGDEEVQEQTELEDEEGETDDQLVTSNEDVTAVEVDDDLPILETSSPKIPADPIPAAVQISTDQQTILLEDIADADLSSVHVEDRSLESASEPTMQVEELQSADEFDAQAIDDLLTTEEAFSEELVFNTLADSAFLMPSEEESLAIDQLISTDLLDEGSADELSEVPILSEMILTPDVTAIEDFLHELDLEFGPDIPQERVVSLVSQLFQLQDLQDLLSDDLNSTEEMDQFVQEMIQIFLMELSLLPLDQQTWQQLLDFRQQIKQQWWRRLGIRLSNPQDFELFFDRFKGHMSLRQVLQIFSHYVNINTDRRLPFESHIERPLLERIVHTPKNLFWSMVLQFKTFSEQSPLVRFSLSAHQPAAVNSREQVCVTLKLFSAQTESLDHHEAWLLSKEEAPEVGDIMMKSFREYFASETDTEAERKLRRMKNLLKPKAMNDCSCGVRRCIHAVVAESLH